MSAAVAALSRVGKVAAAVTSAALIAGLGMPALGGLLLLAIVALGAVCWVIGSQERTDRVSRLLLAWRGNVGCLTRDGGISTSTSAVRRRGRFLPGRS